MFRSVYTAIIRLIYRSVKLLYFRKSSNLQRVNMVFNKLDIILNSGISSFVKYGLNGENVELFSAILCNAHEYSLFFKHSVFDTGRWAIKYLDAGWIRYM